MMLMGLRLFWGSCLQADMVLAASHTQQSTGKLCISQLSQHHDGIMLDTG